ncbi:heavy metal-associated isoprenylated plant protein 32-like [Prunus avium]|uniref:Heavy metal-associated isoprenylated plant protein 32-like n=1 Tax=Prunus avium TaxID=42229 RepID=A0A6P5T7S9_PRUAV|nr:heavy metal-associated isoprenylated plant protein 32-like [Prunus avium]
MSESDGNTGFMSCQLKLDTSTPGWHKTMTKVLSKIKGVSYTIDAQAGIAHVSGTIEPDTLLKLLSKSGKHAELLRIDSGYKHQFYTAKPVANHRNGHGYGQGYYNNHDYGYYNPNGTGNSSHIATDPYHHQRYYPNYYEQTAQPLSFPQPPPRMEIHPFYDPDTQCTIM